MDTSTKSVSASVAIPEGVRMTVSGSLVRVEGAKGRVEKDFSHTPAVFRLGDGGLVIEVPGRSRRSKALLGTIKSHIEGMIVGVTKGYTYRLKIISSHFPITVKVEGRRVSIENFIGERYKRYAEIVGETTVKVKEEDVIVSGPDKEAVGQTAANIENACKISRKDPRKFLDGIYIYQKEVGLA
ncbi:50S ribosomal protein L6 [archaeon HR01]|nr:50S ribosomal protein L6 [archaeon HR01]